MSPGEVRTCPLSRTNAAFQGRSAVNTKVLTLSSALHLGWLLKNQIAVASQKPMSWRQGVSSEGWALCVCVGGAEGTELRVRGGGRSWRVLPAHLHVPQDKDISPMWGDVDRHLLTELLGPFLLLKDSFDVLNFVVLEDLLSGYPFSGHANELIILTSLLQ